MAPRRVDAGDASTCRGRRSWTLRDRPLGRRPAKGGRYGRGRPGHEHPNVHRSRRQQVPARHHRQGAPAEVDDRRGDHRHRPVLIAAGFPAARTLGIAATRDGAHLAATRPPQTGEAGRMSTGWNAFWSNDCEAAFHRSADPGRRRRDTVRPAGRRFRLAGQARRRARRAKLTTGAGQGSLIDASARPKAPLPPCPAVQNRGHADTWMRP